MKFHTDILKQTRILVIGDIMLDCYLWGKVERISPEAPVPIVHVQKKTHMLGGAGNVALNLSCLGCQTQIIGLSGTDWSGRQIASLLENNKIKNHMFSEASYKTITKTRIMAREQQLLRIDEEQAIPLNQNKKKQLLEKLKKNILLFDAVILSDYGKGLLQTRGLTEEIINICRENKKYILVDPKGRDWDRYRFATCITPNTAELKMVAGGKTDTESELIETAVSICNIYGLEWLLVTRGSRGMCITGKKIPPFLLSTQAREVYDVSGAGDTVIAVISAGLAAGLAFMDAASLANRAAGIVVGKIGTQPVTREELQAAMPEIHFPPDSDKIKLMS